MSTSVWIGVDLDGTLAFYERWDGSIGLPIPEMAERVRNWIQDGVEVRIFTARVCLWEKMPDEVDAPYKRGKVANPEKVRAYELDVKPIEDWTERNLGKRLQVTCMKDFKMIELWDDRAVRVVMNKGVRCCPSPLMEKK